MLVDTCIAGASHTGKPLPQGLLTQAALMPSSAQVHLGWAVRRLARAIGYITASSQEVCLELFGRPTFALEFNRLSDRFCVESVIPGGPQRIQVPNPVTQAIRAARSRRERTKVRTCTKAWSPAQCVGQMPSPVRGSTLREYSQRACATRPFPAFSVGVAR